MAAAEMRSRRADLTARAISERYRAHPGLLRSAVLDGSVVEEGPDENVLRTATSLM
jgi:hypothetical protein